MREYVPGVLVRQRKDGFHFMVVDRPRHINLKENPLTLLDGLPIFNLNQLMAFDPLKIKKLDVIANRYFIGQQVYDGLVSYSTYKGRGGRPPVGIHSIGIAINTEPNSITTEWLSRIYLKAQHIVGRVSGHVGGQRDVVVHREFRPLPGEGAAVGVGVHVDAAARSIATKGAYVWVKPAVFADGEQVAHAGVHVDVLDKAHWLVENVAHVDILEAHAPLAAVAPHGLGPSGGSGRFGRPAAVVHKLRDVGRLPHAHLVQVGVHDVAALHALHKHAEREVAVSEVVGDAEAVFGVGVADNLAVVVADAGGVVIEVLVLYLANLLTLNGFGLIRKLRVGDYLG
nr:hypothetical protein [Tanacetum cinerariifolium]